jgi:putative ABC transport system substrate-binding protein
MTSSSMRRRDFITLLGGAAATSPLAARAQQRPTMPMIGFLNAASPDGYAPMVAAFRQGLREAGYVEGQNVAIEYRWAENQPDRLPALAADLVRRQAAVIVTNGARGVMVVKAATSTIPIVFTTISDPVQLGLVASLSRPGGNVTGATTLGDEVGPKRLELLHELVPTATFIAVLVTSPIPDFATYTIDRLQTAAQTLGLRLHFLNAGTEREIDTAFADLVNWEQVLS